jgi:hypothetical protein
LSSKASAAAVISPASLVGCRQRDAAGVGKEGREADIDRDPCRRSPFAGDVLGDPLGQRHQLVLELGAFSDGVLEGGLPAARPRQVLLGGHAGRDPVRMLVIDAANVIGSRPSGWWRDRPGATRHFVERVRATVTAGRLSPPLALVVEGRARAGADDVAVDSVEVVDAPTEGDDTIAAIAEDHRQVIVVTADRGTSRAGPSRQREVVGPSWLLDELVD